MVVMDVMVALEFAAHLAFSDLLVQLVATTSNPAGYRLALP
jgi:hypothetical protein